MRGIKLTIVLKQQFPVGATAPLVPPPRACMGIGTRPAAVMGTGSEHISGALGHFF
jgi:hypothetical protein